MLTRVLSNSAPSLVSRCASLLTGLILVEGVAWGSGECNQQLSAGCWWGENVLGAREKPIELSVPERLVISPHVYGHGSQSYMSDAAFPANMPPLWDLSWGTLNDDMDVPVVLGEWGGLWSATSAWQATMAAYLKERHIGYFYWALNDNYYEFEDAAYEAASMGITLGYKADTYWTDPKGFYAEAYNSHSITVYRD